MSRTRSSASRCCSRTSPTSVVTETPTRRTCTDSGHAGDVPGAPGAWGIGRGGRRLIYLGTAGLLDSFPTRWLMRWQGRRSSVAGARSSGDTLPPAASIGATRTTGCSRSSRATGTTSSTGRTSPSAGPSNTLTVKVRRSSPRTCVWLDYPESAAMRVRLVRTETMRRVGGDVTAGSAGASRCRSSRSSCTPERTDPMGPGCPSLRRGRGVAMLHQHHEFRVEAPVEHARGSGEARDGWLAAVPQPPTRPPPNQYPATRHA